jgi:hypothetical protein
MASPVPRVRNASSCPCCSVWSARTVSLGYPGAFFIRLLPPLAAPLLDDAAASRAPAEGSGCVADGSRVCTMKGRLALAPASAASMAACTAPAIASSCMKRT